MTLLERIKHVYALFWRAPLWIREPGTWLFHFLVGLALGLGLSQYGAGVAAGIYGLKEYQESAHLTAITRDNVFDFLFGVLGGLVGAWIRGSWH
jgi:hypothetical protein